MCFDDMCIGSTILLTSNPGTVPTIKITYHALCFEAGRVSRQVYALNQAHNVLHLYMYIR